MIKTKQKIIRQLKYALRKGLTPQKAAFSIVLGIIWGLFPVVGGGALFCIGSSTIFRLHLPIMWITSMVVMPAQWLLVLPFTISGKYLLGQTTETVVNSGHWFSQTVSFLSGAALSAMVAWLLFCIPLGLLLYGVCIKLILKWQQKAVATGA